MTDKERLEFWLQYHQNLISKLDNKTFSHSGLKKISEKITKVENAIESILLEESQ